MKYYQKIDLSKLPVPKLVEDIDIHKSVLDMEKQYVDEVKKLNIPGVGDDFKLESYDPVRMFFKVSASYNAMIVNKINQAFVARLLSHAEGKELDNLVIDNGTERDGESDDELRQKYLRAFSNLNTAGSFESYAYHVTEKIEGDYGSDLIADCYPYEEVSKATVNIVVLPKREIFLAPENESEEDGNKRLEKIENIRQAVEDYFMNNKYVRPLTNKINVTIAKPVEEDIKVNIYLKEGVSKDLVYKESLKSVQKYIDSSYRIGFDVYESALIHYAMNANVERCVVVPNQDIMCDRNEVFICKSLTVEALDD